MTWELVAMIAVLVLIVASCIAICVTVVSAAVIAAKNAKAKRVTEMINQGIYPSGWNRIK